MIRTTPPKEPRSDLRQVDEVLEVEIPTHYIPGTKLGPVEQT